MSHNYCEKLSVIFQSVPVEICSSFFSCGLSKMFDIDAGKGSPGIDYNLEH